MKTYIVNMEKDTAKRAAIEHQLQTHPELDYQIWKATEGRKLSKEELDRTGYNEFRKKYGDFGTLPAFGCSLSHYYIYQDVASSSDKVALILEDDAILSNEFSNYINVLQSYVTALNEPAAVLLTPDFVYKKNQLLHMEDVPLCITPVLFGYMTSGYLINKRGAELLTKTIFPIRFIADEWNEFHRLGLNIYGVVPHIVSFQDGLGEIGQSQQLTANDSILKKCRHSLGRIKGIILKRINYLKGIRYSAKEW